MSLLNVPYTGICPKIAKHLILIVYTPPNLRIFKSLTDIKQFVLVVHTGWSALACTLSQVEAAAPHWSELAVSTPLIGQNWQSQTKLS